MILFDKPKRLANLAKHGLDFLDLTMAFFENAVVFPGRFGRQRAIGMFRGRAITVVFRWYGREAVSVISMRPASKVERSVL